MKPLLNDAAKSPDAPLDPVFDHITATFEDTKDKIFLRDLVAVVLEACLEGKENLVTLDQAKLTRMSAVLKPYLDAQKDREVQALYSLQALVHRLEHPNKLLHSIFDVLYEVELISEVLIVQSKLPYLSLFNPSRTPSFTGKSQQRLVNRKARELRSSHAPSSSRSYLQYIDHLVTYAFLQWLRTAEEDDPEAETSPADIPEDQQKVSEHSEQRLLSRSTQGLI